MDKKNVISLVLGLIIGGLAIWMITLFTNGGSTMILRHGNTSNPTNSVIPTPTPTQILDGEIGTEGKPLNVQCQNYNIGTQRFEWTTNGTGYWMKSEMSGEKCGKTFTIKEIDLVDTSDSLKTKDQQNKNPSAVDIVNIMPNTDSDTNNFKTIVSNIKTATGASSIAISDNLKNGPRISGNLQSADACSIKDAGWWGEGYKKGNDWCDRHPILCGIGIAIAVTLLF